MQTIIVSKNKCDKNHQNLETVNYNLQNNFHCVFKQLEWNFIQQNNITCLSIDFNSFKENVLSFSEIIKGLRGNDFIFIYYLLYTNDLLQIREIKKNRYSEFLHSIVALENGVYVICYKTVHLEDLDYLIDNTLNNYINTANGIWIDEIPNLSFEKRQNEWVLSVDFKKCFMELSSDADELHIYFHTIQEMNNYLDNLGEKKNLKVEEAIFACVEEEID